jgi:MFS superfamily sulfate permease-like transporter
LHIFPSVLPVQKTWKEIGIDSVKSTFSPFQWFPLVDKEVFKADMIAGLTVGIMVVPQSMAYADIAGLQPVYGLYSSITPLFIYALFGMSRELAVGPVAMVSLLTEAGLSGMLTEGVRTNT